jgi:hypothetical protein
MTMSQQTALAAAAGLVALAFGLTLLDRWELRRRPHELAWAVALFLFSAGAFALWTGAATGWNPAAFRLFYLFGAIVNVPFLALGTIYLLGGRKAGDRAAAAISLLSAFAAGVVLAAPMHGRIRPDELPRGSEVFGALPRVLAAVASAGGAIVVFGGAAWSAWRFRRGRMVWANGLIAAGTLILSAGGIFNSVFDAMTAFAVTLVAGIAVIYAGFLVASAPTGAAPAARPSRRDLAGAGRRT